MKFRISPAVKDNQRLLRKRFDKNRLHPRQWMTGRHRDEEWIATDLLKIYSRGGFLAGLHHEGEMQFSVSQLVAEFISSAIMQHDLDSRRRLLKFRKRTRQYMQIQRRHISNLKFPKLTASQRAHLCNGFVRAFEYSSRLFEKQFPLLSQQHAM